MKSLLTAAIAGLASTASAQFVGLGMLPGATGSRAVDISADGTTIIGNTPLDAFSSDNPWRWTRDAGLVALPLPANSIATSVSDDGAVVGGLQLNTGRVYLWRLGSGAEQLPLVNFDNLTAGLTTGPVVSGDGQAVFGRAIPGGLTRWTSSSAAAIPEGPVRVFHDQCTHNYHRVPQSVVATNYNGSIAAGRGQEIDHWGCPPGESGTTPGAIFSYLWRMSAGTEVRSAPLREILDMSSDGSVLLLWANPDLQWSDGDGAPLTLTGLHPPGNPGSPKLSGDGQMAIAGNLIWDWYHGTRTLEETFAFYGLDTRGWSNFFATGLAYHGTVLCGYATNPSGATEAWFADLLGVCQPADFNHDGDVGTDADIEAFFACLGGNCCSTCGSVDVNNDGDVGTDADIEAFFRVLAGGTC